jgi:hypothetical protein
MIPKGLITRVLVFVSLTLGIAYLSNNLYQRDMPAEDSITALQQFDKSKSEEARKELIRSRARNNYAFALAALGAEVLVFTVCFGIYIKPFISEE